MNNNQKVRKCEFKGYFYEECGDPAKKYKTQYIGPAGSSVECLQLFVTLCDVHKRRHEAHYTFRPIEYINA